MKTQELIINIKKEKALHSKLLELEAAQNRNKLEIKECAAKIRDLRKSSFEIISEL